MLHKSLLSPTFAAFVCLRVAVGQLYPSIQWTPQNPLFSGNRTQCVYPMSKIIFVCPNPAMMVGIQKDSTAKERMYENLWQVDKQSYEQCKVNRSHPQTYLLLKCERPLELSYSVVVFNEFSAQEGGPEYLPGEEYHFIATSDGTQASLDSDSAGHCMTSNMRMRFLVCANKSDVRCKSADKCNVREGPTIPTTAKETQEATFTTAAPSTTTKATRNITRGTSRPQGPPPCPSLAKLYWAIGVLTVMTVILFVMLARALYVLRRGRREDDVGQSEAGEKIRTEVYTMV